MNIKLSQEEAKKFWEFYNQHAKCRIRDLPFIGEKRILQIKTRDYFRIIDHSNGWKSISFYCSCGDGKQLSEIWWERTESDKHYAVFLDEGARFYPKSGEVELHIKEPIMKAKWVDWKTIEDEQGNKWVVGMSFNTPVNRIYATYTSESGCLTKTGYFNANKMELYETVVNYDASKATDKDVGYLVIPKDGYHKYASRSTAEAAAKNKVSNYGGNYYVVKTVSQIHFVENLVVTDLENE